MDNVPKIRILARVLAIVAKNARLESLDKSVALVGTNQSVIGSNAYLAGIESFGPSHPGTGSLRPEFGMDNHGRFAPELQGYGCQVAGG